MSRTRGPWRTRSATRWPARLNGAPSIQRVVKPSVRSSALKTSPTCRTPARFIVPLLMLTTRSSSASAASWSASTAAAIVDTSFESPGCPSTPAVAVIARQAIAMSFMAGSLSQLTTVVDARAPKQNTAAYLGTVPNRGARWGLSPVPMPELPDSALYLHALEVRVVGRPLEGVRLASPFLVRTVDPPLTSLHGAVVRRLRRIGKRIVFEFDGPRFLVLHLMIAGRLRWQAAGAALTGRMSLAAFDFSDGTLILTEAGSKKRASLHVVAGEQALDDH